MLRELQLFQDGCDALGVKESDVWTYRVTATEVRIVLKDGRKFVLEVVNLNPEATRDASLPQHDTRGGGRSTAGARPVQRGKRRG